MRLGEIYVNYENKYVILLPYLLDAKSNRPLAYWVLADTTSPSEAVRLLEYFRNEEELSNVFILPTFDGDVPLDVSETVDLFRVLLGV